MTFQPVVPSSGLTGWVFLQNTMNRQTEIFNKSPELVRDTDYFQQNIGAITSAEELVSDRRLLRVALGAFGLQDDINSKAFVQKILEEGASDDGALANRLSDDRYQKLAEAFGFDRLSGPRTSDEGFGAEIVSAFRRQSFEVAVGDQDQTLRLALNAERELPEIALSDQSDDAKWFSIMGSQPLRQVFETLLGLPSGFGQVDIDQQLEVFRDRAERQLGIETLEDLAEPEVLENLVERFLLRDQIASGAALSSSAIALTLLQSATPVGQFF